MSLSDPLVREVLDGQVPVRLERLPDWADVLARSANNRERRHRRTLAVLAIAAALAIAASALAATGHDPFGTLSAWLNGKPGRPASAGEQAGFAARNDVAYLAFPSDTKIRLVDEADAGGKTFHLLGFKSGDSLCLRLIQANLPAALGRNECVTLRELTLSPSPALVASEASFIVGDPPHNVDGIFGFADDTVQKLEYRRGHGPWRTVPVRNNVFVALDAKKATGVRGPRLTPITQVRAVTQTGKVIAVPFISGAADYTAGLPSQPTYLSPATATPAQLPGPTTPSVHFGNGTISWLVHEQPRGRAWSPTIRMGQLGSFVYSRAVQPDPASPLAVGLFLIRLKPGARIPHGTPGELILCEHALAAFGVGGGYGCRYPASSQSLFPTDQPFIVDSGPGGQITNITGAAADGVAGLKLFLASGRVIPAALKDNAFTISAPSDQLPGKLVAYDSNGRVLGLQILGGAEHPVPCPPLPALPASTIPAAAPYEQLNLATLTVNGSTILGKTPEQVEAALGRPDRQAGFVHRGFGPPAFFYGGTLPGAPLIVHFTGKPGHYRATTVAYQGRTLTDSKLGHLLNQQPQTLQHAIASSYGTHFRLTNTYGSVLQQIGAAGGGCTGTFTSTAGGVTLSFGVEPYAGARPFLTISRPSILTISRP